MATKMTKKDCFTALLQMDEVQSNQTLVDFINHELELLAKKNSAEKKPTATQLANDDFKSAILAHMSMTPDQLFTITELIKSVPEIADLTNQRVSAIVGQMVKAGSLVRVDDKRKAFFKVA